MIKAQDDRVVEVAHLAECHVNTKWFLLTTPTRCSPQSGFKRESCLTREFRAWITDAFCVRQEEDLIDEVRPSLSDNAAARSRRITLVPVISPTRTAQWHPICRPDPSQRPEDAGTQQFSGPEDGPMEPTHEPNSYRYPGLLGIA